MWQNYISHGHKIPIGCVGYVMKLDMAWIRPTCICIRVSTGEILLQVEQGKLSSIGLCPLYLLFYKGFIFQSEVYTDRYEELLSRQQNLSPTKHSNLEHELVLKILKEKKGIGTPPDVFEVILYEKNTALAKLCLKDEELHLDCAPEEVTDSHQIFNCNVRTQFYKTTRRIAFCIYAIERQDLGESIAKKALVRLRPWLTISQLLIFQVCGENIMSFTNPEQHNNIWNAHCSTMRHQKCRMMSVCLGESKV